MKLYIHIKYCFKPAITDVGDTAELYRLVKQVFFLYTWVCKTDNVRNGSTAVGSNSYAFPTHFAFHLAVSVSMARHEDEV